MEKNYPQKHGIDYLLKTAFSYWSRTLKYQLAFSIIYFSILFIIYSTFATKYGLLTEFMEASKHLSDFKTYNEHLQKISQSSEWAKLTWILIGTLVFLYPLNLGIFKIFRKLDLKETPTINDLFAGYMGSNFFTFTSYFLFWFIIYSYTMPTIILGIAWLLATLFSAPLMFFMDKRIFETIELNFKVLKLNFLEILVCFIVGMLFKYSGAVLCGVGILLTFPFMNAMIYAMYQKYFREVN